MRLRLCPRRDPEWEILREIFTTLYGRSAMPLMLNASTVVGQLMLWTTRFGNCEMERATAIGWRNGSHLSTMVYNSNEITFYKRDYSSSLLVKNGQVWINGCLQSPPLDITLSNTVLSIGVGLVSIFLSIPSHEAHYYAQVLTIVTSTCISVTLVIPR